MGFVWALLLALHVVPGAVAPARAQGSRKDNIVFNSRGVPLAGASVRVCLMPATGQPCTPLALIYSDAALTQALANPTTSDGLGNYSFYAAPGKYEIEISGPGITTRQIPNVILPSDPTAPNFSSVSSSGAISAFSLNLTGNLNVTGNASVAGSLAGGTLNLANQSTPPGAASTGTVNLYTKTSDKRLYYKDETGTEIGPVANTTGAQTNVTNTFTAAQNFDADVHHKGPNPWFDITRYGGVASSQSTTGSITTGTSTLTLAAAQDFANGQGIVVYGAGSATVLGTPGTPVVTPLGAVVNGATTYNYQVACEDYKGGLTAASATGSTTVGPAALGVAPSITISSWSRSGGVTTYTTSTAHNLQVGFPANVSGIADGSFDGSFIVASAPTATTFTISQATAPDVTSTSGTATLQGLAYNQVTWAVPTNFFNNELRCWIYRNGSLAGVMPGVDGYYEDYGVGLASGQPTYVPTTPPASAQAGYLATTISSGGGTTTLTLAVNAGTTVSSAKVLHDNVPALNAAQAAAVAGNNSGIVYIPNTGNAGAYAINSAWVMPAPPVGAVKYLIAGAFNNSQPIVVASNSVFEGVPGSLPTQSPSFGKGEYAMIQGSNSNGVAYPVFFAPVTRSNVVLRRVNVYVLSNQAVGFAADEGTDGSGSTDFVFDNAYFTMGTGQAVRIQGGFGFYFDRTGFNMQNAAFGTPYAVRFTDANYATNPQVPGIGYFTDCWFGGAGVLIDNRPRSSPSPIGGNNWQIVKTVYESGRTPIMRVDMSGQFTGDTYIQNVDVADFAGGSATPMIDTSNSGNLQFLKIVASTAVNSNMPFVVGNPSALTLDATPIGTVAGVGSTAYTLLQAGFYDSHNLTTIYTGGNVLAPLSKPAAPTATVAAGGSLAAGHNYFFAIAALDADGAASANIGNSSPGSTVLGSPSAAACATSTGNQTCTITWTAVTGAASYDIWIGDGFGPVNGACGCFVQHNVGNVTSFNLTTLPAGASVANFTNAGLWKLKPAGQLQLVGENISAAPRAEQNVFLPGVLTSAWTGATWTLDRAVTVTRVEVQAKTAPSGCSTNAVVRLTDGTTPVNVTISAAASSSGAITQNYAAGSAITVAVQTAAAGCATSPADANVVVQYRMQ